jgi:hypothetical protein
VQAIAFQRYLDHRLHHFLDATALKPIFMPGGLRG